MEHPNIVLKNESIYTSRIFLENKEDYIILDTETSGLGEKDVIIQIAAIDLDGNVLLDSLVKPKKRKSISREATAIHGINSKKLEYAPHFADVFCHLLPFIKARKKFLIYNFEFDKRMIEQTLRADELAFSEQIIGRCIMLSYSKYVGQWNPLYEDFKYQRLVGGDHTAIGDCYATLALIKKMAEDDAVPIPEGYNPQFMPKAKTVKSDSIPESNNSFTAGCLLAVTFFIIFWYLSC